MTDKRKIGIIITTIILMIALTIGGTYALYTFFGGGEKINTITTSTLSMSFTESENVIELTGALPTTDITGKTLDDYFDFTVEKTGNIQDIINYEIAAKKQDGNTISGNYIKLYLTEVNGASETELMSPTTYEEIMDINEETGRPSGMMSLCSGSYEAGEITKNYRLRMWVSDEYNPQGDGGGLTFSVKVNAYGAQKITPVRIIKRYPDMNSTEDFKAYKDSITSVITKEDVNIPSTAVESWDVSELQDGSVIAYIEDDGREMETFTLTIGANGGKINLNEDSSGLFFYFTKAETFDLSHVDSSYVTNMMGMFAGCQALTTLNVDMFDTSKVTNMGSMFSECLSLTELDVSTWTLQTLEICLGCFLIVAL